MVGYDPEIQELSKLEHGAAGATSGIITRMITQPLDVIKIRFQVDFYRPRTGTREGDVLRVFVILFWGRGQPCPPNEWGIRPHSPLAR